MELVEFSGKLANEIALLKEKVNTYWKVMYRVNGEFVEWYNDTIPFTTKYFDSKEKAETYASNATEEMNTLLYGSVVDGTVDVVISQCDIDDIHQVLHALTL